MKKTSEYQQHAADCRQLASKMAVGEHRDQLLEMASTWETLAEDRSAFVRRHPELAQPEASASAGQAGRETEAAESTPYGSSSMSQYR